MYLFSLPELEYASCMHNVLTAIDTAELVTLLEKSRLESAQLSEEADREAAGEGALLAGGRSNG